MTDMTDRILLDLSPFADLGTEAPTVTRTNGGYLIVFYRNGEEKRLSVTQSGAVVEYTNGNERKHRDLRALLASADFADLGKWADSQTVLLRRNVELDTLPVKGLLSGNEFEGDIDLVDNALRPDKDAGSRNTVILLDGPAGIGKTSIIRRLAYQRALNYRVTQYPLILHVESRGRVLQNLTDLMAFSLQTIRANVAYDQVPSLVRNGLITLAIDGFDELGDPNGYDLAWAQLNELVVSIRGSGSLLLSGRETFISKSRISTALSAIDTAIDRLESFSVSPVSPATAKDWLLGQGWSQEVLASDAAAPLFDDGSYALRPFFLRQLAEEDIANQIRVGTLDDLLSFLINAMLNREASKFGRDVEAITSHPERVTFLRSLMEEVARDLAENQTESIPSETIGWLAEAVSDGVLPPEIVGILKNRAGVVAFLTDDVRRGHRRFIHEQVQGYFLAHATVSSVRSGELSKFIRRSIMGPEFLESFADVVRHMDGTLIDAFAAKALELISGLSDFDRARGNLTALLLATHSVSGSDTPMLIQDVSLDEAVVAETVGPLTLRNVTIAQLYARGADMREVKFENCNIVSLIASGGTIPSTTIPVPTVLTLPSRVLSSPGEIDSWYSSQYLATVPRRPIKDILADIKSAPLFNLLSRLTRHRPFWLVDSEDRASRKVLDDPYWPVLKELLLKHDQLVERDDVPASGPKTTFYHLRNKEALIALERPSPEIIEFISDILKVSMNILREQ